jgi:hypothetical protein
MLDLSLDSLPARPPVYTHNRMCAWLSERHDKALEVATNTLDVAQTINARGDQAAASDLIAEAGLYLAEARAIQAMRRPR